MAYKSTTTLAAIRAASPCESGWKKLLAALGKAKADSEPLDLLTVLNSNGLDDALWVLSFAMPDDRLARHFQAWCAEQVLHIFEAVRPDDRRVRDQIKMLRRDDATKAERDAARDAVRVAAKAVRVAADAAARASARADADAARASAEAARVAARDAADAAAWASARDAADAAWASAWASAEAARDAAWASARASARDATRDATWDAQESRLRKMLNEVA